MRCLYSFLWAGLLAATGVGFAQTTVLNGTSGNSTNSSNFSTGTSGSSITLSQGFFAEYLIVGGGGGGGGGGYYGGGGGGGGGGGAGAVSTGSSAITTGTYQVMVGAGGSGGGGGQFGGGWVGATGANGASSSAFGVTSVGGEAGWGAGINTVSPTFTWTDGTGGWGGWSGSTSGGGKSYNTSGGAGGGGAGSSGVGGSASGNGAGAAGGTGTIISLTGSSQTYGVGGAGGNGSSANVVGASGAANTGNGGAGGGGVIITSAAAKSGGAGGSGLVVVRYAGAQAGTGGTVTAGSGSAAGNTLHTFSTTGSGTLDLSGLNLDTRLKTTLTGAIAGAGNLTYAGPGTLVTKAVNTYSGTTTVSGGTMIVDTGASIANSSVTTVGSGAHLKVNGAAGKVTVNGTLSGSGSVGAMTLNSGGLLAVGNSPGLMTATSAIWNEGSTFQFEIINATGVAGTDWDLLSVSGALDLTTIRPAAKMNLLVVSTALQNYTADTQYSWVFAKAASLSAEALPWTSGLDVTDRFAIDSTGFNGGTQPGRGFKVVTGTDGGFATLSLQAVPEPSAGVLVVLGLTTLLKRRKHK